MKNHMTSEEIGKQYNRIFHKDCEIVNGVCVSCTDEFKTKQWLSKEFVDKCIEELRKDYCMESPETCPEEPYCDMCTALNVLKKKLEEK